MPPFQASKVIKIENANVPEKHQERKWYDHISYNQGGGFLERGANV